jgi:hypothetical protein
MTPKIGRSSNTYLWQSRLQTYIEDKEGHSILIKEEIDQKEISVINLYAPNVNTHNFIKHTLKVLKTYINPNTVVVGDFNTPLPSICRSSKHKNQERNPRSKTYHRSNGPS